MTAKDNSDTSNEEQILITHTVLVKKFGASRSLFLTLLHTKIKSGKGIFSEGQRWIKGPAEYWSEMTGISPKQIHRVITELSRDNIIRIGKSSRNKYNVSNYYTLMPETHVLIDELFGIQKNREIA